MFSVKIWTAYKSKGVGSLSAKQNRVKNCSCVNYKFFTLFINDKRSKIYPSRDVNIVSPVQSVL